MSICHAAALKILSTQNKFQFIQRYKGTFCVWDIQRSESACVMAIQLKNKTRGKPAPQTVRTNCTNT